MNKLENFKEQQNKSFFLTYNKLWFLKNNLESEQDRSYIGFLREIKS